MPFIVDSSVTMAWCFADEATPYSQRVLALLRADSATVPAIWPLEVANALCMGERRHRLLPAESLRFVSLVSTLRIDVEETDIAGALGAVLDLARAHRLTSYDASYLDLAKRQGLPLATWDARLREAAVHEGVPLVE